VRDRLASIGIVVAESGYFGGNSMGPCTDIHSPQGRSTFEGRHPFHPPPLHLLRIFPLKVLFGIPYYSCLCRIIPIFVLTLTTNSKVFTFLLLPKSSEKGYQFVSASGSMSTGTVRPAIRRTVLTYTDYLRAVPLTCHGHSRPITHLSFSSMVESDQYYLISACKGETIVYLGGLKLTRLRQ
jgi:hypothetical protein